MKTVILVLTIGSIFGQSLQLDPNIIKEIKKSGLNKKEAQVLIDKFKNNESLQLDMPEKPNNTKSEVEKINLTKELKESYKLDLSNTEILKEESDNLKNKEVLDVFDVASDEGSTTVANLKADKFFGYDIFNGNPELFQPSISDRIDPEYAIAPGDEIILLLWGETELNDTFIVEKDGYLFIPNIGQVFVNGLTLSDIESKLFKLLKRVNSSMDPVNGKPSTFLDVSLGSTALRPLRIIVLGEVTQPGAYSVKSSASLFTSLFYFKGPSVKGSLRDIILLRKNKEIARIDFYDYLLSGNQVNDIRLQRDDVIFINKKGKTVSIAGEIHRSAIFELKNEEGLNKLIKMAGGIKPETYLKRAQIKRIVPHEKRIKEGISRTIIDIDLSKILLDNEDFELQDGDEITFFKISDQLTNIVTIKGSVVREGDYDLSEGLSISKLIYKADGVLGDAYLNKVDIERTNSDYSISLIDIDLRKALEGDKGHDILLQSNDIITVYSLSEMLYKTNVSIAGHVKSPGEKVYKKGMQVYDLIFSGGGFEDIDHLSKTYFDRALLTRYDQKTDKYKNINFRLDSVLAGRGVAELELNMGDEITIYSLSDIKGSIDKSVKIRGEIKRPGDYDLFQNMTLNDLLFMAGGLDDKVYMEAVFAERADIVRYNSDYITQRIITFNVRDALDSTSLISQLELIPGDEILIHSNSMFENRSEVIIDGEVKSPGSYFLKESMRLFDLILESGGINSDLHRFRAEISRINPKNENENNYAEVITVDITNQKNIYFNSVESNEKSNIILKPFDMITIRPDPYYSKQRKVSIDGLVYYPGDYVIRNPDEKVTDIINRAGGLRPEAYPLSSKLTRNGNLINLSFEKIIKNPNSKFNFEIIEGDKILIGSRPNLVVVEGQVNNPGNYQYVKGYKIQDYVKACGGFTKNAAKFESYVINADGSSTKWKFFDISKDIKDGSKIVIGSKEETEKFNYTEYVSTWTEFIADLSQAWLMVIIALRS